MSDRTTFPPGSDAIDDPVHTALLATIEASLDRRLKQIHDYVGGKLDSLTGAVRLMASETTRANQALADVAVLKADVEAIKVRCHHCSIIPDAPASPAE